MPVDYRSHVRAAQALRETRSPYSAVADVRETWQTMHDSAVSAFGGDAAEVVAGPYLYPPTLASLLRPGPEAAVLALVLIATATIGVSVAWPLIAGVRSAAGLLIPAASLDIVASFSAGNVEMLVAALSLLACWLLWYGCGVWAAPPAAAVLLLKPPFALLFFAFAALISISNAGRLREIEWAFGFGALLVELETFRWPEPARADFLTYLSDPEAYQFWSFPHDLQWPMNKWNRAPPHLLLTVGRQANPAQGLALALWAILLGVSLVVIRRTESSPDFVACFSVSYALFFLGLPIIWSLPFLGYFTVLAA